MTNKIGWCSLTFNPVWGCNNHCEYCYARKINKRFWAKMLENERNYHFREHQSWAWTGDQLRDLHDFIPTFLEAQFNKKFPKKPQRIFVGSMSEIYYWEKEWIRDMLDKILEYPQHTFQFLTKFPEVYYNWNFPKNCWLGVTVTDNKKLKPLWQHKGRVKYVSIEPLLEEIKIETIDNFNSNWIIIGAETGNRKGKIIPKKEWIENIVDYCKRDKISVYLKDSLREIYPVEIKEFPNC